jgi:hypothetical protein
VSVPKCPILKPVSRSDVWIGNANSVASPIGRAITSVTEEEAEQWFVSLQEIVGTTIDSAVFRKYKDDAIAGGLAVLFVKHRDWLRQHPEHESWCLTALRDLEVVPDRRGQHPAPILSSEDKAEPFRAEAALALLEDRDDPWILRAVLDGLTGYFYQSTSLVMYAAYTKRSILGPRFEELISLTNLWSAIRHAVTVLHSPYAWQEFGRYRDLIFSRLSSGRLRERPVSIECEHK